MAIEVRVRGAGPTSETDADNGVAHLIEHLLFKGTADKHPGAIDTALEGMGGELSAFTQRDATRFSIIVPAAQWRPALTTLADMLLHPAFRPEDLEAERTVVLSEMTVAQGDAYRAGFAALCAAAFPASDPYRLPLMGPEKNARRLTAEDLRAFHTRLYRPENLTIAVAGPVTEAEVQSAVKEIFPMPPAAAPGETPAPAANETALSATAVTLLDRPVRAPLVPAAPGRGLVTVYVAFRAPAAAAPDATACMVLAQALTRPGSGLLYKRLVAPGRVLAASAECLLLRHGGLFILSATSDSATGPTADDLEEKLLAALAQLREDGIAAEDLTAAQGALVGQSLYEQETPEGWARRAADADVLGLPPDFLSGYAARIRAITAPDMLHIARTYLLPLHQAVVVVTPAAPASTPSSGGSQP